jgi:hypothetical protein
MGSKWGQPMNFRKRVFRIFSCPTGFYHPLAGSLEGPEGGEIISHRDTEGTEFFKMGSANEF